MSIAPSADRRQIIKAGFAAAAGTMLGARLSALGADDLKEGDEVIEFLDPQLVNPQRPMIHWPELESWITPDERFFSVSHYGVPTAADPAQWRLQIDGLIGEPRSFSLDELRGRPRVEHIATLECSGNGASPAFMGAIGNAKWAGTPLAPLLRECVPNAQAKEVVFFGADQGKEKIREQEYEQQFARSLSLEDATKETVLLAYEMNGKPLDQAHGSRLRLVVPGWYGIAWVKWLTRIELHDRRYMGRFMARDYVTIRGEPQGPGGEEVIWRETSVGPMRIKSIIARVVRRADGSVRLFGAAWNDGTPLKAVEVKIDDGTWTAALLHDDERAKYAWTFWSYDWKNATSGEHTLVSRAIDVQGRVQPAADDPAIALKKTYWEANQQVVRRVKI